jgi:hypothetical protein
VQTADAGSFSPIPGTTDSFRLLLQPAGNHFTYFTDRPEREAGLVPAATLLEQWPFNPENPPNAALALQTAPDALAVVVLELLNPPNVATDGSISYTVRVISSNAAPGFDTLTESLTADRLPPTFAAASLFIDGATIDSAVFHNITRIYHYQYGAQ